MTIQKLVIFNSVSAFACQTHLFLFRFSLLRDVFAPPDGVANLRDTSPDLIPNPCSLVPKHFRSSIEPSNPLVGSKSSYIAPAISWNIGKVNVVGARNRIDSSVVRDSSNWSKIDVHCGRRTEPSASRCLCNMILISYSINDWIENLLTHKSSAEIDGGSAINSKSGGGSFGTNCCSATCFSNSCCFWWAADDTCNFCPPGVNADWGSAANKQWKQNR